PAEIASACRELFKTHQKCFGYLRIHFLREQQGNIDVDAFTQELLNGGKPFWRPRDFNHYIFPRHRFPESSGFLNASLRVVTQIRGDFEAYVSVATFCFLINRTQKIRSILNVANGKN